MAVVTRSPDPGELAAGSRSATLAILTHTQYWYALIVLTVFFTVAATHSILSAKASVKKATTLKGPGGKPLPLEKNKNATKNADAWGPKFAGCGRAFFILCSIAIVGSFIASSTALGLHAFVYDRTQRWMHVGTWWWTGESAIVYLFGAGFLHFYFLISLFEWKVAPVIPHFVAWCLCLVGEVILLLCTLYRAANCQHLDPDVPAENQQCIGYWDRLDITLYLTRSLILGGMCSVYALVWISRASKAVKAKSECVGHDETTPLLGGSHKLYDSHDSDDHHDDDSVHDYHSAAHTDNEHDDDDNHSHGGHDDANESAPRLKEEQNAFYRPRKLPKKSWWEYISGYSVFFPYLWPRDSPKLICIALVCFALVILQRYINILVPSQVGEVTQKLLETNGANWYESMKSGHFPLKELILLGTYWGLQGSGGLLSSFRSLLWIKVSQYSYRGLSTSAFEHVHSLSLDFHLGKRTGEVLSALNKGASINTFLEQITFDVIPMLLDLIFAIFFFWSYFGSVFAVLIGVNTFWYLYLTVQMAQTRAEQRREMTNADREEEAVKTDSITCYETVKYFNAESFEFGRYRNAIADFQTAEAQVSRGTNRMTIVQALVYNGGRLLGAILGAWKVSNGLMTVGEFTTLLAYLAQLQGPLNFFGSFYRSVQAAMISGERLLELFKIQPTVVDTPHAKKLKDCKGFIRWRDVKFAYDSRKPALERINFECKPGTTTAFVGESGGGKSTVFRLMFRYYNTSAGCIEIDGYDVKDLTIDSVRSHIGVVPQDTTLFNDTLMFNLKYANQNASDKDVYDACKAASIHDRIMSWPDGYLTKVGERGLRLSGGEKQRIAIARTILKNPRIIMLDEATSALDTNTEQQIQDKLGNLGFGRTLLIIAHRLSTITEADQIIVLHAGEVAEKGTHEELLEKKGRYAQMWERQIKAEKAARHADIVGRRAMRLMRQANIVGNDSGDGRSDGYNSMSSSAILPSGTDGQSKSAPQTAGEENTCSSSSSSDAGSLHNEPR